ncbi:MAG: tryptophan 7-halogenase [Dehalococcoidia bacterium]|nr:tryptophan 7-halogenase [Dehalococcoidia bacterium]
MEKFDVIIIGGGPAGSTAATLIARQGKSVILIEKEYFPRDHIGESLLPASLPILETLEVHNEIEAAGFLKKYGATMVWGASPDPWSWYFSETNRKYTHSYQVVRSTFDQILLNNSIKAGVDVREGHQVTKIHHENNHVSGIEIKTPDNITIDLIAPITIDASGQSAIIARNMDLLVWDDFFQNLAVYGYFNNAKPLNMPDENNIFIEAHSEGWNWLIPLHTGSVSVGVVVDSSKAAQELYGADLEAFLNKYVACSPHIADLLSNATLNTPPQAVRDWSYAANSFVGDGYILVGDAACFIDPLFSSGVHLAMNAGVLASAYVNTLFLDKALALESRAIYTKLYRQQYEHFRELAKLFYSSNRTTDSYFWETRKLTPDAFDLPARTAFINAVAGQPAKGYERVVIDQGEAPDFIVNAIRQIEDDRNHRQLEIETYIQNFHNCIPKLDTEVTLKNEPILDDDQFIKNYVIYTKNRTIGYPVSNLIAASFPYIDGINTIETIVHEISIEYGIDTDTIIPSITDAFKIMYIDGILETFIL